MRIIRHRLAVAATAIAVAGDSRSGRADRAGGVETRGHRAAYGFRPGPGCDPGRRLRALPAIEHEGASPAAAAGFARNDSNALMRTA